jgi:hypothetical protein
MSAEAFVTVVKMVTFMVCVVFTPVKTRFAGAYVQYTPTGTLVPQLAVSVPV